MKTHFKKILVSFFVITSFVIYSTYQRLGGPQNIFDNSQTRQVAAESYSDLYASSYKNQTSANPPNLNQMNIKVDGEIVYNGPYKDGQYDGIVADAFYGTVQVRAIIQSGKLVDVQLLNSPNDRSYSIEINNSVIPILKAEAIKIQSAQVDIVSGATNTSIAFIESLDSALSQAKTSSTPISFLQASNSRVNIVSGATNVVTGPATGALAAITNQNGTVDIVTGATNTVTGSNSIAGVIQNQNGTVDIISGATNTSTSSLTGSAIQNQNGTVNIVSGATNISSGTVFEDEDEFDDDEYEYESDEDNDHDFDDEYEDD